VSLLTFTPKGIYCEQGKFYIDPWQPVENAIITHAHADHSRQGMKNYLAHNDSEPVMRLRLGSDINLQTVGYGKKTIINGVEVSLHPAGHIIGSAQVRAAYKGEVWVASGDYKLEQDETVTPFEPVKCDHFITESTFGLPVFEWQSSKTIFNEINNWWLKNKSEGKTSVLVCYALGKAQRILKGIDSSIGEIYAHGSICNIQRLFIENGFEFPEVHYAGAEVEKQKYEGALVLTTNSVLGTNWSRRFKSYSLAYASGWMAMRGSRRRRAADVGFVLSDHADWQGLNEAVKLTGAENIYVTHGYTNIFTRWLNEQGYNAQEVQTEFTGESIDAQSEEE